MAMQGQNPSEIIEKMARVITERKKGVPLEDAVAKAFEPPKAPKQPDPAASIDPNVPDVPTQMAGAPGAPKTEPVQNEALPQGPPAMQQLLAGLTGSGEPNLSGRVVRQIPA